MAPQPHRLLVQACFRTRMVLVAAKNHLDLKFAKLVAARNPQIAALHETVHDSTIYSLSSGHGKAGVAVIRVSGPSASRVLHSVAKMEKLPRERTAILRRLIDPSTGELIDKGLVLWFRGPASFTGEDCCELHVHGGMAVISALLASLSTLDGFRQSEPGEFTRRAFLNGKLDLTAVEGIADLIDAETEAQRRQALRQADGELHRYYFSWRNRLLKAVAHVEAFIDFSEDENIEGDVLEKVKEEIQKLLSEVRRHLADERRGERLRSGVHIVIVGSPNVGKSSLLNLICQRPAAIVSPIAGTTRDVVECAVNIGGYPALISDTAGLRESDDLVEKEGIKRARFRAEHADLVIIMLDSTQLNENITNDEITDYVKSLIVDLRLGSDGLLNGFDSDIDSVNQIPSSMINVLVAVNKIDIVMKEITDKLCEMTTPFDMVPLSCISERGAELFMQKFTSKMKSLCANVAAEVPYLTQARHRDHLNKTAQCLENYLNTVESDVVLAARELRKSIRQLGKISGEVTTEHVLDVLFREFCIGK